MELGPFSSPLPLISPKHLPLFFPKTYYWNRQWLHIVLHTGSTGAGTHMTDVHKCPGVELPTQQTGLNWQVPSKEALVPLFQPFAEHGQIKGRGMKAIFVSSCKVASFGAKCGEGKKNQKVQSQPPTKIHCGKWVGGGAKHITTHPPNRSSLATLQATTFWKLQLLPMLGSSRCHCQHSEISKSSRLLPGQVSSWDHHRPEAKGTKLGSQLLSVPGREACVAVKPTCTPHPLA